MDLFAGSKDWHLKEGLKQITGFEWKRTLFVDFLGELDPTFIARIRKQIKELE